MKISKYHIKQFLLTDQEIKRHELDMFISMVFMIVIFLTASYFIIIAG